MSDDERYQYGVRVRRSTTPQIGKLAKRLGYIVDEPGGFYGRPQVGGMFDDLAEAIRSDIEGVVKAFTSIGVFNKGA